MLAHKDESEATVARRAEPDFVNSPDEAPAVAWERLPPASVARLQGQVGNAAVARLLGPGGARRGLALQRQDAPADGGSAAGSGAAAGGPASAAPDGGVPPAAQALIGQEFPVPLSAPDPLPVPDTGQMGDFPTPGEGGSPSSPPTAMALRDESLPWPPLQRDDDSPHISGDAAGQGAGTAAQTPNTPKAAPVQIDLSLIYRNLDVWQSPDKNWEVVHEPQIQLIGDSGLTLSVQESVTLVNSHWVPPWKKEIEVGLSGFAQQRLLPSFQASGGAQVQAEQHLTPWFSITATLTGTYAAPTGGQTTGVLSLTAGGGVLIHFDGFGGGS